MMRSTLSCLLLVLAAGSTRAQDEVCPPSGPSTVRCTIPLAEDTLFYIENRGVTRVLANLNGFPFKFVTDPMEAEQGDNAFLVPLNGIITVSIGEYMGPGFDSNFIELTTQGPAGSDWEFIIAPVFVQGQEEVAYRVEGLVPFPEALALLRDYGPNPFRDRVTLSYEIPENRITGLPVSLVVYDRLGRRVRTLVEARQFPGTFTVGWDGRDGSGRPAASGLYIVHLTAGEAKESIRLVRIR